MKKLIVLAAFTLAAVLIVNVWAASRHLNISDSPDRNVPGATTGKGKNSLAAP